MTSWQQTTNSERNKHWK